MPLKPIYRYIFAALLLAYSAMQLLTRFIIPSSVDIELLTGNTWLFGFGGWFVILFGLLFMSPALLVLIFALRYRQNPDKLTYHKEPLSENEPIPEDLVDWEFEIRTLGFDFFGMFQGIHQSRVELNHVAWTYVNEARDVYADITLFENGTKAIEFVTEFADGFQLGTLYNLALNVDSDIIYCRSFKGSISEAHGYHVYQVDLRAPQQSVILKPETVADYLHSPERDKELNFAINESVIRDNLKIVQAYSLYIAPAIAMMLLSFVIPLFYANILFASITGFVFIFVDATKLKMSYVTVDDTRKASG